MINAIHTVIENGICSLKSLFQSTYPGVTYNAVSAKHRWWKMSLAAHLKINK